MSYLVKCLIKTYFFLSITGLHQYFSSGTPSISFERNYQEPRFQYIGRPILTQIILGRGQSKIPRPLCKGRLLSNSEKSLNHCINKWDHFRGMGYYFSSRPDDYFKEITGRSWKSGIQTWRNLKLILKTSSVDGDFHFFFIRKGPFPLSTGKDYSIE